MLPGLTWFRLLQQTSKAVCG